MGNLIKVVPSLNEKIPTLNSLLPILSEQTPSQNNDDFLHLLLFLTYHKLHWMNSFYHL